MRRIFKDIVNRTLTNPKTFNTLNIDDFLSKEITIKTASIKPDDSGRITIPSIYTSTDNKRFEHSWRADPVVRTAITKRVDFIVGERPITVLDTTKEFTGDQDAIVQAFNNVVGNSTYQEMKSWIDGLNTKVGYHLKLKAALTQQLVFGRSVLAIERYDEDSAPTGLKILNAQNLSEVIVENDSWALYGVRYNQTDSNDKERSIILADDMIYFTNLNHNITENSLWHGYSEIEGIAAVSECNRIIDNIDMKEINTRLWSGYGLVKFNDTKDPDAMKNLLGNYKPGTWMATDANIEVDIKTIDHSLKDLIEERKENDLRIARGTQVPSFLLGFENITNRSTVKAVLESWKVGTISGDRTNVKNIVEPQWYEPLVIYYLGEHNIHSIQVKIKQEFRDVVFDTTKDQVDAFLPLYQEQLITADDFLRQIGLDYIADKAKLMEQEMFQRGEELKREIAMRLDSMVGTNGGTEDVGKEIETKMLKDTIISELDKSIKNQINFSQKSLVEQAIMQKLKENNIQKN